MPSADLAPCVGLWRMITVTERIITVLRSPDPPVRHSGERLAPDQAEHRLQVPHGMAPAAEGYAANGEGFPRQVHLLVH